MITYTTSHMAITVTLTPEELKAIENAIAASMKLGPLRMIPAAQAARDDAVTPGCETCETHGVQCLDCIEQDKSGEARCVPSWSSQRDLLARHYAHITGTSCPSS